MLTSIGVCGQFCREILHLSLPQFRKISGTTRGKELNFLEFMQSNFPHLGQILGFCACLRFSIYLAVVALSRRGQTNVSEFVRGIVVVGFLLLLSLWILIIQTTILLSFLFLNRFNFPFCNEKYF